jgi:hypothetical protein
MTSTSTPTDIFADPHTPQMQLIKLAQAWALRQDFDPERARALRRTAILANHSHYLEKIPAYSRLAREEGIGSLDDVAPIKQRLMLPDEVFKSYDQRWLDRRDFTSMNGWLSDIHHRRVDAEVAGLQSIDEWIVRLSQAGLRLVYSSGTSGMFSFVPRDEMNRRLQRMASTCYLVPLLMHEKLGTLWQRIQVQVGSRLVTPEAFARFSSKAGMRDFDAVFLDFRRGHTGNQELEQELAPLFRRCYFLYDVDLSPEILRLAVRGAQTEEDQKLLDALQQEVVVKKEQNFARISAQITQSVADGQKVFIFGAPFQYKELCEYLAAQHAPLPLRAGSLLLFGGGWKSFTGQRIARDTLVTMIAECFGLPPDRILEGYSMTEINVFMLRCDHGRFHIPPLIEPVILDNELCPAEGPDLHGIFGFLDPLAISYPGFIISGDLVHMVDGDCPCGLRGPAVTEIGRAQSREIKGCGGVMASVAA